MAEHRRQIARPDIENAAAALRNGKTIAETKPGALIRRRPVLGDVGNKAGALLANRAASKPTVPPHVDAKKGDENKSAVGARDSFRRAPVSTKSAPPFVKDPDEGPQDPLLVPEYVKDIYNYLLVLENRYEIRKGFLSEHRTSPKMRAILVNWLVDLQNHFKVSLEAMHMSVSLLDRALQEDKTIDRTNLQLVGATCLFLAMKIEEIYQANIDDLVEVAADSFTRNQFKQMEMRILKLLDFNMGKPLPIHFLRRYSKIGEVKIAEHNMGKYILELGLLDHACSQWAPSLQAAAACFLGQVLLSSEPVTSGKVWTATMAEHTTYSFGDFKMVVGHFVELLLQVAQGRHNSKTVVQKYASSKFGKVSLHCNLKEDCLKQKSRMIGVIVPKSVVASKAPQTGASR